MKIKDIEINNFRIYKDYNYIDLLPEKDKNIVIVSGKNGFGKTTFLMSLVWCLYGKQMPDVDTLYKEEINQQRSYPQYMSKSINRLANAEGKNKFSVSITFVEINIPIEIPCKELKITRTYDTHTNDEKVEILINGVPNDLTNDYGYEKFIRDFILPIEIAKFFFFDAEKIVSLAEVHSTDQRKQLSKAFSEVIGIKKYEDLKENVNGLLLNLKNQSAKPEDRLRLNELNGNIQANQILITELKDKVKELTDENQTLQYDWNEAVEKLMSVGHTVSDKELEEMKNKLKELDEKKKRLQNELKTYYEIIPFGIAGEKLLEVVNQVSQEAEYNKVKYNHENVDNKTNIIVDELFKDFQKEKEKYKDYVYHVELETFLMKTIKKLIKKHVYNNDEIELPFGFDILHNYSNNEKSQLDDLVNHLKLSFREELKRMSSEQEQIIDELTRINRKISDAEKNLQNEIVAELRQKRLNLEQ
ncbi:MAG: AAA family ATPase, partial [Bacteroidales bacterium]|nr:AAA family ATPase [Bacteroidales bacterium]